MPLRLVTCLLLLVGSLASAVASAEEAPEMQNRLLRENQLAMHHYAQQRAQLAQHKQAGDDHHAHS